MAASEIHVKSTAPSTSGCVGNKPHKCYICDRRFVSQDGLEDRVRTYYDEEHPAKSSPETEANAGILTALNALFVTKCSRQTRNGSVI